MPHCYLCGVLLDKSNSSVEHIIPNALGGDLKSRQLLCKKCNSDIGHQADSELANLQKVGSILIIGVDLK